MLQDFEEEDKLAAEFNLGVVTLLKELVVPLGFGDRLDRGWRSSHILCERRGRKKSKISNMNIFSKKFCQTDKNRPSI